MFLIIFNESRCLHHHVGLLDADALPREGLADEELAKKQAERAPKRKLDTGDLSSSRKRYRSVSSSSSNSVSTISTNLSRSPSPKRVDEGHTGHSQLLSHLEVDRKRRRSRSSSTSYTSDASRGHGRRNSSREMRNEEHGKSTRYRDQTPTRGQRRDRVRSRSSRSISQASESPVGRTDPRHGEDRSKRRRHSSRSPIDRGRENFNVRGSRRPKSPGASRDRSLVVRNRKSMTPALSKPDDGRVSNDHGESRYSRENERYGSSAQDREGNIRDIRPPANDSLPQRQRSLSPFSKRLALTQAMNAGR